MAVRTDGTVDPFLDPQDEEVLPPNKEGEGENSEHQEEEPLDEHMEASQYSWDTEEEEETEDNVVTYRSNAIQITLDEKGNTMTKVMAVCEKTTVLSKIVEPMYSHRSRHREWPSWPHSNKCTLAGYREINGVKAHCLLDSGSEGVLSPEVMQATGIKTFPLEHPIALQLACIGG